MKLESAIKNRVIELCEKNEMTMTQLAAEISQELVDELLDETVRTKVPTIGVFCRAVGVHVADFFRTDDFVKCEP